MHPGKFPTPPTLMLQPDPTPRNSCLAVEFALFFGEGSKTFRPIFTRSRTGKPKEDIHSPVGLGPPKDCIYDGGTEKNSDNI